MSFRIEATSEFEKELKQLSKKYISLKRNFFVIIIMGGKFSTYKHKSFHWTKPRKKRSALFTRFLSVLLYTRSYDLFPNSILFIEDIPFPTDTDNWSMQEYNIWSSLLNVLICDRLFKKRCLLLEKITEYFGTKYYN